MRKRPILRSIVLLALFAFCAACSSLVVSYDPTISLFKLVVFVLAASTCLVAFDQPGGGRDYWLHWFFTLYCVLLFASAPLLFSGLGYLRNGSGFQGILGQPQAYGVLMALLFVVPVSAWLAAGGRGRLLGLSVALGCLTIVESGCRTAVSALLLGLMVTIVCGAVARRDWLRHLTAIGRTGPGIVTLLALLLAASYQAGPAARKAGAFVSKGGTATGLGGAFDSSRGGLARRSWSNYTAHSLLGVGFGMASDSEEFQVVRDPFLNLPVSAPVEKGFLPTAVLEENGVVGAALLLLLLGSLTWQVIRGGGFDRSWLFWTCIAINGGEMVFFSPGGLGLLMWLLLAFSSSAAAGVPPNAHPVLARHAQPAPGRPHPRVGILHGP